MPVRVFKAYDFHRWATRERLSDPDLSRAANEIESGLVDAGLGGPLVKKRVGGAGRGKRGGYRVVVAYRRGDRMVFLHGFDKRDKDNISSRELDALRKLGDYYMTLSGAELSAAARDGKIIEVRG
jgi:hypothetical protein